MSLGIKQGKIYLNIKQGKIVHRTGTGQEALYDFIEGSLVDITQRDREFKGETVVYWYFDIQTETGEIYSLSIHYSSGVAKSILNALGSAEVLGKIRIETYQSGDFTKAVVYNNGERLSWKYSELPPLEEVKVGDKLVKDDSKRMELFNRMAQEIVTKINTLI